MEKNATLNLRVNTEVKRKAEDVLRQLGIPMSTAIEMYLRQISLTGGIPFDVVLPKAPDSLNMDYMNSKQIYEELQKGLDDLRTGKVMEASTAFKEFEKHI